MGLITSKDTRRISFNNTFALTPVLIQKSIEDTANIIAIDNCEKNSSSDLNYKDTSSRLIDLRDEDYDYWAHRIECLKNDHQQINQILEEEYQKTIDNTNKLFHPPKISQEKLQKLKPCFEWRAKILQCYEDNPRQPLICSAVVQEFSNCVSSCQLED
ncbi:MICOS complex subunit mic25-a-like [Pararge aegeria]|uniref:Jg11489 protein n=1 Tax=Pararge aegeria aegeria TaxID=348720 RepID=A0A8S4RN65_9NEOP|nr:MICOS complex subunit mic25-a-like [Pararge aegeria]CAH2238207.1 jg11489 [Pararge aegeria aegeria]